MLPDLNTTSEMIERWVFLNGQFVLEKLAAIPVTDRGFLFGEGIFTTIRVHQGRCELFRSHVERLEKQAKALNFTWDFQNFGWISELIKRNRAQDGIWRLKIVATVKEQSTERVAGNILAMLDPYQGTTSDPCTLCLFPYPVESPLADIKSLSYLDHLYVRNYANRLGYTDAITRTRDGILLETGCSNIFWIDQGKCWIPDLELPYLKGVLLQGLLQHSTWPIQFVNATIEQVPKSANVYICNALTHVRPVISIDQCHFQRCGQKEKLLQQTIAQVLRFENAEH